MLGKIRGFTHFYATLSALLLSAVFMTIVTVFGSFLIDLAPAVRLALFTVGQLILTAIAIWIMRKLEVFDINDFKFKGMGKGLLLAWFGIVYVIISFFIARAQIPDNSFIVPAFFYLLIVVVHPFIGTGLYEEVLFRGLVLKLMLKKTGFTKRGVVYACVISSVFFGLVHISNIIAGAPVLPTVTQIIHASATGFFFAVIYLRTRKLLITILFHGLLNLSVQIFNAIVSPEVLMQNAEIQAEPDIISFIANTAFIALPVLIAGLILLRKVKPKV